VYKSLVYGLFLLFLFFLSIAALTSHEAVWGASIIARWCIGDELDSRRRRRRRRSRHSLGGNFRR
jgi:hypothetical protein